MDLIKPAETKIKNSTTQDISEIQRLYALATLHQVSRNVVAWPVFDTTLIEREINEQRQWKLISNNIIACIWSTSFSDPHIWEEKNIDAAVYIHRISTNPDFRGNNLVAKIVDWAIAYAKIHVKKYIRMDTVGNNEKLIEHYKNAGFQFLDFSKLQNTGSLPAHYNNAVVSLFEIKL